MSRQTGLPSTRPLLQASRSSGFMRQKNLTKQHIYYELKYAGIHAINSLHLPRFEAETSSEAWDVTSRETVVGEGN